MRRIWIVAPALLFVACEAVTNPPMAPRRVENPALMLVFSDLPEGCEVERNEGSELVFACRVDEVAGRVAVGVSEPERVDLRQTARDQQQHFEALPEGAYFGIVELVTPTGPAYTARGRYVHEGDAVEEVQIHVVHPSERDRRLTLRYSYPERDRDHSQARRDQLMFLTGEVDGLEPEPETL